MQATDLGHGRGWLDKGAALSIARIDDQIGHPLQITEAGRTWAQQNAHWQTYLRDGSPIALSPDAPSIHQLGNAIDTDERNVPVLNDHGWFQTVYRNGVLVEPWHFEYDKTRDNHEGDDMFTDNDRALLKRVDAANRNGKKGSHTDGTNTARLKRVEAKLAAQDAAIEALAAASGADPKAILKAVQDGVSKALDGLTLTIDADA